MNDKPMILWEDIERTDVVTGKETRDVEMSKHVGDDDSEHFDDRSVTPADKRRRTEDIFKKVLKFD